MKKNILLFLFSITLFLIESCSSSDDSSASPSEDGFISPISQLWSDSLTIKSYFFGNPDGDGRFTGVETEINNNSHFLSGKTKGFAISFTVIKDQNSNYVDYAGTLTDTSITHMRMTVYSKIDTLYLHQ